MWGTVYSLQVQFFLWRSLEVPCPRWHHARVVMARRWEATGWGHFSIPTLHMAYESTDGCAALWSVRLLYQTRHQFCPEVRARFSDTVSALSLFQAPNPPGNANGSLKQGHPSSKSCPRWAEPPQLNSAATSPLLNKSFNNRQLNSLYSHISWLKKTPSDWKSDYHWSQPRSRFLFFNSHGHLLSISA